MSRRSPRPFTRALIRTSALTALAVGLAAVGAAPASAAGSAATSTAAAAAAMHPAAETAVRSAGTASTSAATPVDAPNATHAVTLITGDRVEVTDLSDGTHAVEIETATPGAGVKTFEVGGDLHVVPESAMPFTASGALDPDLFNVSLLIRDGYDDASVDATPVIVVLDDAPTARALPVPSDLTLAAQLESIDGAAGTVAHESAAGFWAALTDAAVTDAAPSDRRFDGELTLPPSTLAGGIEAIHLDGKVRATLDSSVPYIGADEAWADGFDGQGATVAVLDTGYDDTHPDLAGRVLTEASTSFVPGEEVAFDPQGHGTHVAATVAGTGAASGGVERGVADGADLLIGKVLDAGGYGQDSWIIAGMQWAGANADIVSMSLGSQEASDGTDLMATALNEISAETDALFIVAAGNSTDPETIGSPGAATAALTVGSVDDPSGTLSDFSSQGPTTRSGALKPEITGPGNEITAARSADSPGEGSYITFSGTSMATPHVAGAAAIVKGQHPEYSAAQLRAALISTATDVGLTSYQAGSGVVDVGEAVDATVLASGSGDFGMLRWGEEPTPVSRTVDYTNRGETDVTVELEASLSLDGEVSPALTMNAKSLDVPAGATRSVTLTVDPSLVVAGTQLSGALVGTVALEGGGTDVTRTALGTIAESERYDLTLTVTDFEGAPTGAYVWVYDAQNEFVMTLPVLGEYTVRLPAGRYSVMSFLELHAASDSLASILVGDPDVVLDGNASVALDARSAKKVTVDVGTAGLQGAYRRLAFTADGFAGSATVADDVDDLYAQPMAVPGLEDFSFTTRWRLQQPTLTLVASGEPLDVTNLAGSTPTDGVIDAPAVSAGLGSVDDFAAVDVRGKVAVVTRSDEFSGSQRSANALAAGAELLIVVNNEPGEFTDWVGNDDGTVSPLTVAGVSGVQGERLLAKLAASPVQVSGRGILDSPEIYDISRYSAGEIPTDLAFVPTELARIDTRYFGARQTVGEFRYDFTPGTQYGTGYLMRGTSDFTRTEYVNTDDVRWYQTATAVDALWTVRDTTRTYTPGQQVGASYFGGVVRPNVGPGYWAPFRSGDNAQINVPSWADGGDPLHTGAFDIFAGSADFAQLTDVYIDGVKVSSSPYQSASVDGIPSDSARWRVVNTATQDGSFLPSSTRTETAWSFDSDAGADVYARQLFPMMQAAYDVTLDDAGLAGAGRWQGLPLKMGLELGHVGGAVGAAEVTGAKLQVRVAGGDWRPALLVQRGESSGEGTAPVDGFPTGRAFVSKYVALLPVTTAGGWIDLKVTATDAAGNGFVQEIENAVQVAPAKRWWPNGLRGAGAM